MKFYFWNRDTITPQKQMLHMSFWSFGKTVIFIAGGKNLVHLLKKKKHTWKFWNKHVFSELYSVKMRAWHTYGTSLYIFKSINGWLWRAYIAYIYFHVYACIPICFTLWRKLDLFSGHLSHSGDLLLWVGVHRRASSVVS